MSRNYFFDSSKRKNKQRGAIKKLLFFVALSFCSIDTFAQEKRLDFSVEKMSLEATLIQLSEVADQAILFHPDLVKGYPTISLTLENQPIEAILTECLKNTSLTFDLINQQIILKIRPPKLRTLSGFIEDQKTGERLISATIFDSKTGKGTITNEYGFYSFQVVEGQINVAVSYLGYESIDQKVTIKENKILNFSLAPAQDLSLAEVVVKSNTSSQKKVSTIGFSTFAVQGKTIEEKPTLGGEPDVLRYFALQTGVQTGADGLSGLHIRGGDTDQNLVLMDGVPIYVPSHTFGLFSVFNNPTIKTARLEKNGFSARYGGRLSSVIDVRTKEGNNQTFSGSLGLSTLATNLLLEGPIIKDKIGILLSARRSHIDPFVRSLSQKEKRQEEVKGQSNYYFYDLNAKVHAKLSKKDKVFVSLYQGEDQFQDTNGYREEFEEDYYYYSEVYASNWVQQLGWGNTIGAFRWNHLFGQKLFSNATLTFSDYEYNSQNFSDYYRETDGFVQEDERYYTRFQTKIKDAGAKLDFDYFPNNNHHIRFGGGVLWRKFEPGLIEIQDQDFINFSDFAAIEDNVLEVYSPLTSTATEYNLYAENRFTLLDKFHFQIGVHAALFSSANANFSSLQPRLNASTFLTKNIKTTLSASKMTQFLHVLSSSGSGFPNDMWVPSTENAPPQDAWQISNTTDFIFSKKLTLSAGAFYKKMEHLVTYQNAATLPSLFENDPEFWEEDITKGQGESYGLETAIVAKSRIGQLEINYNWTKATRQFDQLNNNRAFPYRFNHEHQLTAIFRHQFQSYLFFNILWDFGSGQNITLLRTETEFLPLDNLQPPPENRLSSVNGFQLPAYHRLDLNAEFVFRKKKLSHRLILGVYNVYNRQNAYLIYEVNNPDFEELNGRKRKSALPLLPTLSYKISFNHQ